MKNTVIIKVITRKEDQRFIINLDPALSDAVQLIDFMKVHGLSKKKYQLFKNFEYDPNIEIWIPRYDLVEICTLSIDTIKKEG